MAPAEIIRQEDTGRGVSPPVGDGTEQGPNESEIDQDVPESPGTEMQSANEGDSVEVNIGDVGTQSESEPAAPLEEQEQEPTPEPAASGEPSENDGEPSSDPAGSETPAEPDGA